ncbi:MAG: stage II sporulation protein R [Provencibacterium sp.]|nr:stage II sporulation protein R [Provencibacterium sp.]
MKNGKLYKWELALMAGLFFAIGSAALSAFAEGCGELRDSVVRLHILAHSDEPCDQQIKLEVRDALLEQFGEQLGAAGDKRQAQARLSALLPQMEETARRVIAADDCDYPVQARQVRMYFETRSYGDITLPAGMYDAVQVRIGSAAGHNWWCVLYPPVCVYSAASSEQLSSLRSDEVAEKSPVYEPRFKIIEWIEGCKAAFGKEEGGRLES